MGIHQKTVCITGLNGSGKTNILDAIYYSCFTKSYFTSKDSLIQQKGLEGFYIHTQFAIDGMVSQYKIIYRENGKKELFKDDIPLVSAKAYLNGHICVMISPDDINIITEGGEYRRKYLDTLLSIIEPAYLEHLLTYNKILSLRNALLKNWQFATTNEREMLSIYTDKIKPYLVAIQQYREQYLPKLFEIIRHIYADFCGDKEQIQLDYKSNVETTQLDSIILNNYTKDIAAQRTTWGVHRDDIDITMNDLAFKQIASQGQRKTMLFALKLATVQFIQQAKGYYPILLLDDVFEKLDKERSVQLFNYIKQYNFQTFITDTDISRLQNEFGDEAQYIEI